MRERVATKQQTTSLFAGERRICRPQTDYKFLFINNYTLTHVAKFLRPQTD
jgi:hypothetical protein